MEASLVKWINTFEGLDVPPVADLCELADGLVLHLVLREIAPNHFPSGLLKDCGTNTILRSTNIKKLLRALEGYYKEALLQNVEMSAVDADKVAQGDCQEVGKLVQMVLGCAVQCDEKHRYIERVLKLDKASQADLMVLTKQCIQRGEQCAMDTDITLNASHESQGGDAALAGLQEELRQLHVRVEDLEGMNAALQLELDQARERQEELKTDLAEATEQSFQYQRLYNEQLEDSVRSTARQSTRVTSDQAELEMRMAEAEAEAAALRSVLAEREALAQEKQTLQDCLQLSKNEVQELSAEVSRLKGYKDKLELAGDVRRRLQEKEEENESLMEQLVEKEEEAEAHHRSANALKGEIDALKQSLMDVQGAARLGRVVVSQQADDGGKADHDFSYDQLLEKFQNAQSELRSVKFELENAVNDLAALSTIGSDEEGVDQSVDGLGKRDKAQDLKLQNARLMMQLRTVKAQLDGQQGGSGENDGELRAVLAELRAEKEMLSACQEERSLLQAELVIARMASESSETVAASEVTNLRQEVERLRAESSKLQDDRTSLLSEKVCLERQVFEAEKLTWEAQQKLAALQGQDASKTDDLLLSENQHLRADLADKRRLLARKDEELAEMRRIKNEVQAAAADNCQAPLLQQQLLEMQRKDEESAKAAKRMLAAQEREQQMLVSLMYDLGMEMHRTKMYQRANVEKPPLVSWLEQRRRDFYGAR